MRSEQFYGVMRHLLTHELVGTRTQAIRTEGWWEGFHKRSDEQMDRLFFRVPTDKEWIQALIGFPSMAPIWKTLMEKEE